MQLIAKKAAVAKLRDYVPQSFADHILSGDLDIERDYPEG